MLLESLLSGQKFSMGISVNTKGLTSEPSWDTCTHKEMRAWDWELLRTWVPSWTEPNNDWRSYQNHLFNTLLHALDIFVYITNSNTSNSSTITKCITTIVFWLVKQFSSHSWWWKKDGKDTVSYSTIILLIVILVIVVLLLNVLQPNYYCFLIGQTVFQPQLVVEKRWQRYCIIQYY